jgi:hypothetical protein
MCKENPEYTPVMHHTVTNEQVYKNEFPFIDHEKQHLFHIKRTSEDLKFSEIKDYIFRVNSCKKAESLLSGCKKGNGSNAALILILDTK